MLAKKFPSSPSEPPTRPLNPRPVLGFEPVPSANTHLLLVRAPSPTPRGLSWARRGVAPCFDPLSLASMLRLERLNLG